MPTTNPPLAPTLALTLPSCMLLGTEFTKINNRNKGTKAKVFKYDPTLQRITWDSRKLGVIQLEWITCIEMGSGIQDFPAASQFNLENRIVIRYTHKGVERRLNLVANSKAVAQEWYRYLSEMVASERSTSLNSFYDSFDRRLESWLRQGWAVVDKNKDGRIALKEFKSFLNLINYDCSDSDLRALFKLADPQGSNYLDFESTKNVYYILQSRPDVHDVFRAINQPGGSAMGETDFINFLKLQQKEAHSPEWLSSLFQKYSHGNPLGLNEKQFLCFLYSEDNSPLRPIEDLPKHDMDQPLNDYWISCSHNTYLTGDQIKSSSSTTMYKEALLKGCRCVELDCWDGPKGEPIIYHGYTLTSKILFKDVIETVRDHAFTTSPYPVILSLEVHCSMAQQDVMANHLKTILGDSLITSRLEDPAADPGSLRLPSPNQLLYKILIKGKSLELKSSAVPSVSEPPNKGESPGAKATMAEGYFTKMEAAPGKVGDEVESPTKAEKKAKVKVSKLLSDLTPYCQAKKFKGFQHALDNCQYFQMASFSEASLLESFTKATLRARTLDFLKHNRRFLSRVYPDGLRIDSSNFNPLPFWLAGFQLVALNYQKFGKWGHGAPTELNRLDLGMLINQSWFRQNRQLGYILKPERMRQSTPELPPPESTRYCLQVRVISGQNLPKPSDEVSGEVVDPQIEVEMITVEPGVQFSSGQVATPATQGFNNMREESPASAEDLAQVVVRKCTKSEVVADNGFNPTWSLKTAFVFSDLEMSFLRFKVVEFNKRTANAIIGQFCVRLADLKSGYRHIPILNHAGVEYPFASLFIFTSLEAYHDPPSPAPNEVTAHQYLPATPPSNPNVPQMPYPRAAAGDVATS